MNFFFLYRYLRLQFVQQHRESIDLLPQYSSDFPCSQVNCGICHTDLAPNFYKFQQVKRPFPHIHRIKRKPGLIASRPGLSLVSDCYTKVNSHFQVIITASSCHQIQAIGTLVYPSEDRSICFPLRANLCLGFESGRVGCFPWERPQESPQRYHLICISHPIYCSIIPRLRTRRPVQRGYLLLARGRRQHER